MNRVSTRRWRRLAVERLEDRCLLSVGAYHLVAATTELRADAATVDAPADATGVLVEAKAQTED